MCASALIDSGIFNRRSSLDFLDEDLDFGELNLGASLGGDSLEGIVGNTGAGPEGMPMSGSAVMGVFQGDDVGLDVHVSEGMHMRLSSAYLDEFGDAPFDVGSGVSALAVPGQ